MNMFEEARSVDGMMRMLGATQNEMAKRLGKSQSYIANKLRLLKLSPECEKLIIENELSERHARAVLRLSSNKDRLSALEKIKTRGLTVSQSEALVDLIYSEDAPMRIKSHEGNAKTAFFDSISSGVQALVSLGISATKTVSYYGNKAYITVCIDET